MTNKVLDYNQGLQLYLHHRRPRMKEPIMSCSTEVSRSVSGPVLTYMLAPVHGVIIVTQLKDPV